MINIGDKFNTESFGWVVVVDVFISPTTQERAYLVRPLDTAETFLVTGHELQWPMPTKPIIKLNSSAIRRKVGSVRRRVPGAEPEVKLSSRI
mgnify:CR=1 FL=1